LLGVDELLAPVKAVVVEDPTCPVALEKSVEPVPLVPKLKTVVGCVATVVPGILKRKPFIS